MPILTDIEIGIGPEDTDSMPSMRRQGPLRSRASSLAREIVPELLRSAVPGPSIAWNIVDVVGRHGGSVVLDGGREIEAPVLAHRLSNAKQIAFLVATLGGGVGDFISRLFASGQQVKAVLAEELANVWLRKVGEHGKACIDMSACSSGMQVSGPLSAGDDGFPLEAQAAVLALAQSEGISVGLTGRAMMNPRHSVSSVFGVGQRMSSWTHAENCTACRAGERCPYRSPETAVAG